MKINQYLLNTLKTDEKNFLSKDSIFKGKIVDIFGSKVLLEVQGKNIIPAILDSDVKVSIGDEMIFLVKSSNKSEILIKTIGNEELQELKDLTRVKSDSSISKLLKNMNIEENKTSLDLVKNLIKSNIPLKKETINMGIKTLEKIGELSTLSDDDKIILLNELKTENLSKDIKLLQSNNSEDKKDLNFSSENKNVDGKSNDNIKSIKFIDNKTFSDKDTKELENKTGLNLSIKDEITSLKSDLKNMIIVKGDTIFTEKDITLTIKDILDQYESINLKENSAKLVTLFIKHDIKINLNNIINMQELNQDPDLFIEKLDKLRTFIRKEIGEKEFKEIFESVENKNIESSKSIKNETSQIEELLEKAHSNSKFNIDKEIVELKSKNDFLTDINKNLLFTLIPITHGKHNLNGLVNFIKKNNKKFNKEKTNVFINLNTNNLDNIKVSCHFASENIGIKIGMKKKHLNLFKENEDILIDKVTNLGYKVKNINYVLEEEISIIDTINDTSKEISTYYLDVKV